MRCPTCERTFPDDIGFCPHDGGRLVEAPSGESGGDPLVGTVLDGRYRVIACIGAGGFGTVYRGRQVTVDLEVAIKVLSAEASQNLEMVRRFENEAKIISQLRHPNTLKLVDFGRAPDRRLYIVTEFLTGSPLDRVLQRRRLDVLRTVRLLGQVCESLAEAHGRGIVHRDLKPANIFVEKVGDQEVGKVLDFGIAKISHQTTMTAAGQVMGTPPYMSPEQCRGDEIDPRSDLYSLGIVAYECLSGSVPFNAPTPLAILLKHLQEPARPLRSLSLDPALNVDPELDELILTMLAKHPDERPHSAGVVRETLTDIERRLDVRPSRHSIAPSLVPHPASVTSTSTAASAFAPTHAMPTPAASPAPQAPAAFAPTHAMPTPAASPSPQADAATPAGITSPSAWPSGELVVPRKRVPLWVIASAVVVGVAAAGLAVISGRGDAGATPPAAVTIAMPAETAVAPGGARPTPVESAPATAPAPATTAVPQAAPPSQASEPSTPAPASGPAPGPRPRPSAAAPARPAAPKPDLPAKTAAPETAPPAPATLPGMAPVHFGP